MKERARWRSFFDLEFAIIFILGAFALAFLIDTRSYNRIAALFPRLISTITILLLLTYLSYRFWTLMKEKGPSAEEEGEPPMKEAGSISGNVSLALMVGYFLMIFVIGLTWASLAYLILVPVLMGYKRYRIVAITSILWIIAFVCVFHYILHTRIPQGFLGDLYQWIVSR